MPTTFRRATTPSNAHAGAWNGRERAKVELARKLALLPHLVWKTGEACDPFHPSKMRGELVPA